MVLWAVVFLKYNIKVTFAKLNKRASLWFARFVIFHLDFFFLHLGNTDEDTKGKLCHIYSIFFLAAKIFTQFLEVLSIILYCEEKETLIPGIRLLTVVNFTLVNILSKYVLLEQCKIRGCCNVLFLAWLSVVLRSSSILSTFASRFRVIKRK